MSTTFYSSQSRLPSETNRGLIRDALDAAALAVSEMESLIDSLRVEEDTSGKAGSPDITGTILAKIDACSLFVADLTLIGRPPAPNPTVVFEYGYALKSRGRERITAVMNLAFGHPDALPFDLKFRSCSVTDSLPRGSSRRSQEERRQCLVLSSRRHSRHAREREYCKRVQSTRLGASSLHDPEAALGLPIVPRHQGLLAD
jgi:hypothetical protein